MIILSQSGKHESRSKKSGGHQEADQAIN
jgi:hypothetical protein